MGSTPTIDIKNMTKADLELCECGHLAHVHFNMGHGGCRLVECLKDWKCEAFRFNFESLVRETRNEAAQPSQADPKTL